MTTHTVTAETLRLSWRSWFDPAGPRVGPSWLQHVWTVLFSMGVAAVFTVFGFAAARNSADWRNPRLWADWYAATLIISLTIGYLIRYAFALIHRIAGSSGLRRLGGWQRAALVAVCIVAGIEVGCPLASWITGLRIEPYWALRNADDVLAGALLSMLVGFFCYQFFAIKQRQIEAERTAAIARLALLQGQIEPHFLFNTLANVVGLMDADTPRAKHMLESFVDYLRASLGGLRRERHTLGDELELVDAYLRVLAVRMEQRLAYAIDVPDELRGQGLPPLVLQPLVENAIRHGLEPQVEGGRIVVAARRDGAALVLTVEDDGLGLGRARGTHGTGTALANIRERLQGLHGSAAGLTVEDIAPHGVRARLTMPWSDA